jgi:thiazole synthase
VNARNHPEADSWTVAGRTFTSRLIVGTGKYKTFEDNAAAVEAAGAEIVTVAVRRVNIADPKQPARRVDLATPLRPMRFDAHGFVCERPRRRA